jgi:hypothetical protein
MLRNALLDAASARFKGVKSQQWIEAPAARLNRATESIGPDAFCRLNLSGDEIIFKELSHDAGAFSRIDL